MTSESHRSSLGAVGKSPLRVGQLYQLVIKKKIGAELREEILVRYSKHFSGGFPKKMDDVLKQLKQGGGNSHFSEGTYLGQYIYEMRIRKESREKI